MSYPQRRPLGILPVVAAAIIQEAPTILADIGKLFGGTGSYTATHAAILNWCQMILADPVGAVSGQYIIGPNYQGNAAGAYLSLRCWAGDQSILAIYRQVSGDPASNGCGCETQYGCRADAQAALARIDAALNQAAPVVSSAPEPALPGGGVSPTPAGTLITTLPGGATVGVPVSGSTLLSAQLFGIPLAIWALGIGVFAFAGGRRR